MTKNNRARSNMPSVTGILPVMVWPSTSTLSSKLVTSKAQIFLIVVPSCWPRAMNAVKGVLPRWVSGVNSVTQRSDKFVLRVHRPGTRAGAWRVSRFAIGALFVKQGEPRVLGR